MLPQLWGGRFQRFSFPHQRLRIWVGSHNAVKMHLAIGNECTLRFTFVTYLYARESGLTGGPAIPSLNFSKAV